MTGKRYVFGKNPQSIESIALESISGDGGVSLVIRQDGAEQRIVVAPGAWKKSTITVRGAAVPVAASGGWTAPDTYTPIVTRYRTPFSTTYQLRFGGNLLAVRSENNIGSADGRVAEFVGEAGPATTGSPR